MAQIAIRVPDDLMARIERLALEQRRNRSEMMRTLMEDGLELHDEPAKEEPAPGSEAGSPEGTRR